MNNDIPNRQAICDALIEAVLRDSDIVVLCSDSRGSSSMSAFAEKFPKQFVEVGIAEQCLVSVAAGLAKCGKRAFVASPASFISTRSYEQLKVDVAYSGANVKIIGVSGGVSYGALGGTHHSLQDIAAVSAIPNMRVYLPSDRFQTKRLFDELAKDDTPAYIRVGRGAVCDIYDKETPFTMDGAVLLREGTDLLIVACGETVSGALQAALALEADGVGAAVLDMYCVKPFDEEGLIKAAQGVKAVITVEEHSVLGGLGCRVCQVLSEKRPVKVKNIALPDENIIAGNSKEIFAHYGLDAKGIVKTAKEVLSL